MKVPLSILKFTRYEYWPMWLFYLPALPYWLYLSLKNKSLAYFSAANPGIELGGFFGESKSEILHLIDKRYLPKYIEVDNMDFNSIHERLIHEGIAYPCIAKPDVGERGDKVTKIDTPEMLTLYHQHSTTKYIIQEFIPYDIELGVLYSRLPGSEKGQIKNQ